MSIADNQVVQFHYTLRHGERGLSKTSAAKILRPTFMRHGNVIPGLEKSHGRKSRWVMSLK